MIYTRAQLKTRINAGIQGKIGMLISAEDTMNEVVRDVLAANDLRSTKRKATLSPNLFNGINDYLCPSDLKGYGLVDIPGQAKRADGEFSLISPREFDVKKPSGAVAIDDINGVRALKINSIVDSQSIVISELDSLTSASSDGSSWAAFGDATTLAADTDDYIKGNGSIKWNISAAGGTTAGITHSSINSVDMTDYFGGTSAFFVWTKIASSTDITNYILRFGTDSSNYYSKTVTTRADGTAFVNGWNLLKFDVSSYSTTGTPTDTDIKYFAIYMTKATGKVSETDYKFDWLVLKRGVIHDITYYTKYGWQTSGGTFQENSSSDSDLLVADTDEFNLFVREGRVRAGMEVGLQPGEIDRLVAERDQAFESYQMQNPSERLTITQEYYAY